MGLDQYLYRREYVGGWDWKDSTDSDKRERAMYNNIIEYLGIDGVDASPHAYIDVCVAYWRKANAIHKWFCDLDGGRDECQDIRVTRDQLIQLRELCLSVIRQPVSAASTLPTQPGFFFGSYEYDDWYIEDLELTVRQINTILDSTKDVWADFTYRASW